MLPAIRTVLLGVILLMAAAVMQAAELHQTWAELLQRHVVSGVVDYQGFKTDEKLLDSYLVLLGQTDPASLAPEDQLAYYINAYNSYTIKLILDNFTDGQPPRSIRKIGGLFSNPWKISFARLGGKTYSLDNIEHDIIRPRFQEPRIHFAVNCASKSCPPLISEPYQGSRIDAQLEKSTKEFLHDPENNRLDGNTLHVSPIFKWYSEDFQNDPTSFFIAHTDGVLAENLSRIGADIRIEYLDYDWSLNDGRD